MNRHTLSHIFLLAALAAAPLCRAQTFTIARVKYHGGGDWYNDPSCIPNLAAFIRKNTNVPAELKEAQVELTDKELYTFPFLFLTGHGMISFSDKEADNLRDYLQGGGFLYADDDYGMDESFRAAMKKVFPEKKFVELPFSHRIYSIKYTFPNGPPKIHEHDNKPSRGYAILDEFGRIMVYYTYETNISDGWADARVHNDPPEKRLAALQMGTNIVIWALLH